MSRLLSRFFFGKDTRVSGLIALCVVALIALGCTCGKNFDLGNLAKNSNTTSTNSTTADSGNEDMPSKDYLDAIIAETTADFNYAVTLNDFSKMYAKASSDFKNTYTEEEFKGTFKDLVDKKKVVVPILAKAVTMDPELSPEPSIRTEEGLDILVVKGKYPTKPVPMAFEYEYVKRNDEWKLLKFIVKLNKDEEAGASDTGKSEGSAGVTMANFNKIKTGMKYDDVVSILGKEGEILSENEVAGYRTVMYKWEGDDGSWGANMNAIFQNGKLTTKSQFGLK